MPAPYDVIVIGAGPGGASAAYYLGEAGLHVPLLEKETLPRYKACGAGMPREPPSKPKCPQRRRSWRALPAI